jgi:hypothetical protein
VKVYRAEVNLHAFLNSVLYGGGELHGFGYLSNRRLMGPRNDLEDVLATVPRFLIPSVLRASVKYFTGIFRSHLLKSVYEYFVTNTRFHGEELLAARPTPSWTTPCQLSATAYTIYS